MFLIQFISILHNTTVFKPLRAVTISTGSSILTAYYLPLSKQKPLSSSANLNTFAHATARFIPNAWTRLFTFRTSCLVRRRRRSECTSACFVSASVVVVLVASALHGLLGRRLAQLCSTRALRRFEVRRCTVVLCSRRQYVLSAVDLSRKILVVGSLSLYTERRACPQDGVSWLKICLPLSWFVLFSIFWRIGEGRIAVKFHVLRKVRRRLFRKRGTKSWRLFGELCWFFWSCD